MVKKVLSSITGKKTYGRRIFIFLLFLVLATVVWFVNEMSLDYTSDFHYKINTVNSVNRNAPHLTTIDPLDVKVKTRGFLIVYNRMSPPVINIDTKNYKLNKVADQKEAYYLLLNNALRSDILNKIDANVKVESFASDTLFLKLNQK